ncbi:hypothetical protein EON65_02780 [archaeon]|nr:MAG: hypothetical protein EON65_02780 [archaeon]
MLTFDTRYIEQREDQDNIRSIMKLASYFTLSATAMAMMVYYAYYTRKQFYPTVLFLVSSKLSFIVACNLAISLALFVAKFIKSIYFGNLREVEVEVIMEKAKYAFVETCLALTIFRNELSTFNIGLFGAMILIKLLHRLSKCRLEYLEQIAPVSRYIQIRMTFLLVSLMLIDSVGVAYAVYNIMQKGKSVLILFGFEFGLLLVYAFNLKVRFIIQMIDNMLTNGLQSRGVCIMIVDLLCDLVKVVTYLAFFSLIFVYYGVPFHLIRDLWGTCFSFQRKFVSFIKYLQLTRNLDSRFPDATPEEISHAGNCLVCREDMERGKKLPCGHVFHLDCLRMWLQHQQTCPLCRADIPTDGQPAPVPAEVLPAAEPANERAPGPAEVPEPAPQDNLGGVEFAGDVPPSPPGTPERIRRQQLGLGGLRRGLNKEEIPITKDVMPNMYVCLEDLSVYKDPAQNSEKTRTIKKASDLYVVFFVTGCIFILYCYVVYRVR